MFELKNFTQKMYKQKIASLVLLICFCLNKVSAQSQDSILNAIKDLMKETTPKKSYFKAQTSYLTNVVFNGRKDTATLPYLMPSIEYNHKSGLYINATLSYLANKQSRIDVFDLTAGYNFETENQKFYGTAYVNKSFYNNSSNNVQSDVNGNLGAFATYVTDVVSFSTSLNLMFSSTTDLNLNFGIEKLINLNEDETWSITPSVTANFAGTGFYQSFNGKRIGRFGQPVNSRVEISSPKKFQLMAYELSSSINYDAENWGFYVTPYYAIATNPVTTITTVKGPAGNVLPGFPRVNLEKIENSFFAEFGIYVKF
jgi:hypothetical protein